MSIFLDEWSFYSLLIVVSIGLFCFAFARAAARFTGYLLLKIAPSLRVGWRFDMLAACTTVSVAALLVTSAGGLTAPTVALSAGAALALGWSWRSVRWIFVSAFIFLSIVASPQLLSIVTVRVPSYAVEWRSAFRGEQVLLSSLSGDSVAWSPDTSRDRQLYVYYDFVTLREGDDELEMEDRGRNEDGGDSVPAFDWALPIAEAMLGWRRRGPVCTVPEPSASVVFPTQHLTSIGDFLTLRRYGAVRDARSDRVTLFGSHNTVRDSTIRCQVPELNSTVQLAWCLTARSDLVLVNTNLEFSSKFNSSFLKSVRIDFSDSCDALRDQLSTPLSAAVQCLPPREPNITAMDIREELRNTGVSTDFIQGIPPLLKMRIYIPQHTLKVRKMLTAFTDRVVLSAAHGALIVVKAIGRWTAVAFEALLVWFHDLTPYVVTALTHVAQACLGTVCGSSASTCSATGGFCEECGYLAAHSPSYQFGAQCRQYAAAALSSALDAIDLVPGVWALYRWAWDVELAMTKRIICVVYTCLTQATSGFPVLLDGVMWTVSHVTAILMKVAAGLHTVCTSMVSPVLGVLSLRRTFDWLVAEELREMQWELAVVRWIVSRAGRGMILVFYTAMRVIGVGWRVKRTVLGIYEHTSFFIHFFMTLAQTVLLVLALRNEMKDLLAADDAAKARQRQKWMRQSSMGAVGAALASPVAAAAALGNSRFAGRVKSSAIVRTLHGVALLVRSHQYNSVRYVVHHLAMLVVLVGLSVLPFTNKLYNLTLRYILPYMSSQLFLTFFCVPLGPTWHQVLPLTVARGVLASLLQETLGNFLYQLLKDLLIVVLLVGVLALVVWAWPRRGMLARQVSVAIADSLSNSPARAKTSPAKAEAAAVEACDSIDLIGEKGGKAEKRGSDGTSEEGGGGAGGDTSIRRALELDTTP